MKFTRNPNKLKKIIKDSDLSLSLIEITSHQSVLSEDEKLSDETPNLKNKKTNTNSISQKKVPTFQKTKLSGSFINQEKLMFTMRKLEKEFDYLKNFDLKKIDNEFFEVCSYKNFQEYFPHNNLINIVEEFKKIKERDLITCHNSLFYTFNLKKRLDILNDKKMKKKLSSSRRNSNFGSMGSIKKKSQRAFSLFALSKSKFSRQTSIAIKKFKNNNKNK